MPVMDEFRDKVDKMKQAPLKERIAYYTYYYKWHAIAIIATVGMIISLTRSIVSNTETVFYAYVINALQLDEEHARLRDYLIENTAVDVEKESVFLDDTLYLDYESQDMNFVNFQQKLTVMISASEVDMIITDQTTFSNLCQGEMFMDVRALLTDEQVEEYEPYFYYVDMAHFIEYEEAINNGELSYEFPTYNPKDKESMESPVAVGIFLSPDSAIFEEYRFIEEEVVVGIVVNSKRLERTEYFLNMILE